MIYDAIGQKIKELIARDQEAGFQSLEWNSTNDMGNVVASGMYFYRIEAADIANPANGLNQVRKMLVIK